MPRGSWTGDRPVRRCLTSEAGFRDLEFTGVAVHTGPAAFERLVPFGMPRIPPKFLNSVFYLYKSEDDAERGEDFGGTGFLVGVPSRNAGHMFVYAVTNWHVAC